MTDHLKLSAKVEDILAKSRKSLEDINSILGGRENLNISDKKVANTYFDITCGFKDTLPVPIEKRYIKMCDEMVLTKDRDLKEIKAEWKSVEKLNLQKPSTLKSNFTPNIKHPRTTRTVRLRKQMGEMMGSKAISKTQNQQEKFKTPTGTKYLRFFGSPLSISFPEEYPDLVLDDTKNTLFPCRSEKISENEENIVLQTTDKSFRDLNKRTKILRTNLNPNIKHASPTSFVDLSTWHQVLLDKYYTKKRLNDPLVEKDVKEMIALEKCKEKLFKNLELEEDQVQIKNNVTDNTKVIAVINNKLAVENSQKNKCNYLSIKNLPVLYIRGECKVQKSIVIDIKPKVAKNDEDKQKLPTNIQYYEVEHEDRQNEKLDSNKIFEHKSVDEILKYKNNRYHSAFSYGDEQLENQNVSTLQSNLKNDEFNSISGTSNILLESDLSSQTDDEKLQQYKNRPKSKISNFPTVDQDKESTTERIFSKDSNKNKYKISTKVFSILDEVFSEANSTKSNKISYHENIIKPIENIHENKLLSPKFPQRGSNINTSILENRNHDIVDNNGIYKNNDLIEQIFQRIRHDKPEGLKNFKVINSYRFSNSVNKSNNNKIIAEEFKKDNDRLCDCLSNTLNTNNNKIFKDIYNRAEITDKDSKIIDSEKFSVERQTLFKENKTNRNSPVEENNTESSNYNDVLLGVESQSIIKNRYLPLLDTSLSSISNSKQEKIANKLHDDLTSIYSSDSCSIYSLGIDKICKKCSCYHHYQQSLNKKPPQQNHEEKLFNNDSSLLIQKTFSESHFVKSNFHKKGHINKFSFNPTKSYKIIQKEILKKNPKGFKKKRKIQNSSSDSNSNRTSSNFNNINNGMIRRNFIKNDKGFLYANGKKGTSTTKTNKRLYDPEVKRAVKKLLSSLQDESLSNFSSNSNSWKDFLTTSTDSKGKTKSLEGTQSISQEKLSKCLNSKNNTSFKHFLKDMNRFTTCLVNESTFIVESPSRCCDKNIVGNFRDITISSTDSSEKYGSIFIDNENVVNESGSEECKDKETQKKNISSVSIDSQDKLQLLDGVLNIIEDEHCKVENNSIRMISSNESFLLENVWVPENGGMNIADELCKDYRNLCLSDGEVLSLGEI